MLITHGKRSHEYEVGRQDRRKAHCCLSNDDKDVSSDAASNGDEIRSSRTLTVI